MYRIEDNKYEEFKFQIIIDSAGESREVRSVQ